MYYKKFKWIMALLQDLKETMSMSEKRRDSRNRILRTGESQEADGRYKFRYIDANGKRKSVYSWMMIS